MSSEGCVADRSREDHDQTLESSVQVSCEFYASAELPARACRRELNHHDFVSWDTAVLGLNGGARSRKMPSRCTNRGSEALAPHQSHEVRWRCGRTRVGVQGVEIIVGVPFSWHVCGFDRHVLSGDTRAFVDAGEVETRYGPTYSGAEPVYP
jgi:hypothetical protein